MTEPTWFSARLLFESLHPDDDRPTRLFEDRILLLMAEDEEDASVKASALGAKSRNEYRNEAGGRVVWQFVEILDLVQLVNSEVGHGSEVYSQFIDEQDLVAVRRSLKPGKLGDA